MIVFVWLLVVGVVRAVTIVVIREAIKEVRVVIKEARVATTVVIREAKEAMALLQATKVPMTTKEGNASEQPNPKEVEEETPSTLTTKTRLTQISLQMKTKAGPWERMAI